MRMLATNMTQFYTFGNSVTTSLIVRFEYSAINPPSNLIFIVLNVDIHKPIKPYLIYIPVFFFYVNTQFKLSQFFTLEIP